MSSVKEDDRSGEVDGSQKAAGPFVVAGGERPVVLELGKAIFNQMPSPVEVFWDTGPGREDVENTLASVDARLVFYEELLGNSQRAYADYLEEHEKIDRLWKIFQGIDDFADPTPTE